MAERVLFQNPVKQETDEAPDGDPINTSPEIKEGSAQTNIKFEEVLEEGFHGIKKEDPDIPVAPHSPAPPSPATPLASLPLIIHVRSLYPTCDTTSTKATDTYGQPCQSDLQSPDVSQKRERQRSSERTTPFVAGSSGMMTRAKTISSGMTTPDKNGGSRWMMTPANKRSSDMTTPAKEGSSNMTTAAKVGSSGMKTPVTKTSNERRMSAKKRSSEEGSNGMLTPAKKRFRERATPAKEKSSVMTTSAEEGLRGLTAPAEEGSRRMTTQAKQRSSERLASSRKRFSERTTPAKKRSSEQVTPDEVGVIGTTTPGQKGSSCLTTPAEEGSCGIPTQAKKISSERSTPSEEEYSDLTTPGRKGTSRMRTKKKRCTDLNRWHNASEDDEQPPAFLFCPRRPPGVQLDSCWTYSPSDLFQLYFSRNVIQTLCDNTNTNAGRKLSQGKTRQWSDVHPEDMLKFLRIIVYFSLVKTSSMRDLWRKDCLHNFQFPFCIMHRKRFEAIIAYLHMGDPGEDAVNDELKGQPGYDHLFCLRPLLAQIPTACRSFFHPYENLSMDELTVATKAQTGLKQHMTDKWGYKLFILADSKTGYICDFSVSECKAWKPSENGLSFNVVVGLLNVSLLGTGYNVYIDDIHASPALFTHLHQLNYRVCGTMRENSSRIPPTLVNALPKNAQQGEMRWIRDGPLLFVKWKDTREVTMCSSIHKAYDGKTVERRIRKPDGTWSTYQVPVPEPVSEYNKHMGQAELSDALKYYSRTLKTSPWYIRMFLHFVEIAVLNAYILHKELALEKQEKPLTQKRFREILCQELAAIGRTESSTSKTPKSKLPPAPQPQEDQRPRGCLPVPICISSDPRKTTSQGKKYCTHCHLGKTIFKCRSCDVPLCIIVNRMCFTNWHDSKKN